VIFIAKVKYFRNPMQIAAIILLIFFVGWLFWLRKKKKPVILTFPESYRMILEEKVDFYRSLDEQGKIAFEKRMLHFLAQVRITGIQTVVEDQDSVLVAASAIIPIYSFDNWEYINLNEVLLYPGSFSEEFELHEGIERPVSGMVGNGPMQQVMILSQTALREGFMNDSGMHNTAIHEFVHLIDKTDGTIDGIPENLLSKQYTLPWITMMHQKLQEIAEGNSDINPYGATNQGEFFAVVSEYFFGRPDLLQLRHPELYHLLQKIFCQDPNAAGKRGPV
jgi:Mlc titration factor MtfA (ptsG expression regulator)